MRLPIFIFFLTLSCVSQAELVRFRGKEAREYQLQSSKIEVVVKHPLRVVTLSSTALYGAFKKHPDHLRQGVFIALTVPFAHTDANPPQVNKWLKKNLLKREQYTGIVFTSRIFEIEKQNKDGFVGELHGRMKMLRKGAKPVRAKAKLACRTPEKSVACQFSGTIRVSELGVEAPSLLGLKITDEISYSGEASFFPRI